MRVSRPGRHANPNWGRALGAGAAEHLDRQLRHLGRSSADAHALGLERLGLGGGGPRGSGDDRPRVAHGLAGRGGEARDVGEHGLGDVLTDVLGGLLLLVAADLAAHDDELGLIVLLEQRDDVDERRAHDRVAADADDRRVAEPGAGDLVADLVGQRARTRDEADVALGEEVGGDDPHVGLAGRQHARAVGADQASLATTKVRVDPQHVVRGDALGDRDDQVDPGVGGLEDRVGGEPRRHEDHRRVRARLRDGLVHRVEDRGAVDVLAALARRDARDQVGAVALVVAAVERALAAGQAGDDELGVGSDEDAHPASSTTFAAAPSIVCSTCTFGSWASERILRPASSFVPSRRTTKGTSGLILSNASTRPLATSSQRVIPPKMLNRTAVTFSLERITSTASTMASAFDPPPASRKFAGWPPACATTSSVDITSPAPLPRMPTLPSSLT